MIGVASSKRRFENTPGLKGPLSHKAFRSYGGADVDSRMGEILRDRLMKGAQLEVKLTKRFSRKITISNLIYCGMAFVSYPGSGKHNVNGDLPERAVRWEDIDDDEDTPTNATIPQTSGWWPALIVQWVEQHEDHGFATRSEYFERVLVGCLTVYVVCWYQLVDGTYTLTLWPITLPSRI